MLAGLVDRLAAELVKRDDEEAQPKENETQSAFERRYRGGNLETYIFYGMAILALSISFYKDRQKTKAALKKSVEIVGEYFASAI